MSKQYECAGGVKLDGNKPCPECGARPSDGCPKAYASLQQENERLRELLSLFDTEHDGRKPVQYKIVFIFASTRPSENPTYPLTVDVTDKIKSMQDTNHDT